MKSYSPIIQAIIKFNGTTLQKWCKEHGIQPYQLQFIETSNNKKYDVIRKRIANEARKARPKMLAEIDRIASIG